MRIRGIRFHGRRVKQSPEKKLKRDLDTAWALAVKVRDGHRCLMCGKGGIVHAHHWFIRKARSLAIRWETDNGATLCYYCHLCQIHRYSDYEFMTKFFARMKNLIGPEGMGRLVNLAAQKWEFKKIDTAALLSSLLTGSKP